MPKGIKATVLIERHCAVPGGFAAPRSFSVDCDPYTSVSWLVSECIRRFMDETFGEDPGIVGIENRTTGCHLDLADDCIDCIKPGG